MAFSNKPVGVPDLHIPHTETFSFDSIPKCEVPACASNVGSRRNCGRDVLALSLTGFDCRLNWSTQHMR
jgi:hypothetical protein